MSEGVPFPEQASDRAPTLLARAAEAVLFAADEPVHAGRIAAVYAAVTGQPSPDAATVRRAIDGLNAAYEAEGRAMRIEAWAGGYRMATEAGMAPFLKAFFAQATERKLSRSLLETLAILAYRQPATKPEIDFIRGVDSDYALRKLLELGLIDIVGRSETLGRPLLYGTTAHFLEQFGLDALSDLPELREIEELLGDPAFNRERALLLSAGREGAAQPPPEGKDGDS